ncbi:MAG: DUF364 domain-containing protein [Bacteroidales bacterium]|nr:DUF364 domain-containing protein [Bacteroidales bacterium]
MYDLFFNKLKYFLNNDVKVTEIFSAKNFCYVELNNHTLGLSLNFSNLNVMNNNVNSIESVYYNYPVEIKIALLNAISNYILNNLNYELKFPKFYCDPIDLFYFKNKKVLLFGYFKTYVEKLLPLTEALKVIELNPNIILPEHKHLFVEYNSFRNIFSNFNFFIITGSSLVTLKYFEIVETIKNKGIKILVGPTAGILPNLLFDTGIDAIGASQILDTKNIKLYIKDGYCFADLHKKGLVKKITYKKIGET